MRIFRAWSYAIRRAFAAMRRAPVATGMAVGAIALAFVLFGVVHLGARNLASMTGRLGGAHMIVYLDEGVPDERAQAIGAALAQLPAVQRHTYIDAQQALDRLRATLADDELASSLDASMLPASIEVALADGVRDVAAMHPLVARLEAIPGVASVEVTGQWIDRLAALRAGVERAGWILVLLFGAACVCFVWLATGARLRSRQREATVLDMLGASRSFIRGPLVIEGVIQGLAGAALAALVLRVLFSWSAGAVSRGLAHLFDRTESLAFLPPAHVVLLIASGGVLGLLGALLATRQHEHAAV